MPSLEPPRWEAAGGEAATLARVLFLDVDGVLNVYPPRPGEEKMRVEPPLLKRLAELAATTRAVVVLSSAWRLHPRSCVRIAELLEVGG